MGQPNEGVKSELAGYELPESQNMQAEDIYRSKTGLNEKWPFKVIQGHIFQSQ